MRRIFDEEKIRRIPWAVIMVIFVTVVAVLITVSGQSKEDTASGQCGSEIGFFGEYRIAGGDWMHLKDAGHISSTDGTVELKGSFWYTSGETGERTAPVEKGTEISLFLDHVSVTVRGKSGTSWTSDNESTRAGEKVCSEALCTYVLSEDAGTELTVFVYNPHVYGNGKAVDHLLDGMRVPGESNGGGLISEIGVLNVAVGMLLLAFLCILLGASLFASLLRKKYNREIWLLWLLVFFGGIYFIFSRDKISIWNPSHSLNTTLLGASMMLYVVTAFAFIGGYLNGMLRKIAVVAFHILGIASVTSMLVSLSSGVKLYDTYPYFTALAVILAAVLIGCLCVALAHSVRDGAADRKKIYVISLAVLVGYITDAAATLLGIWQGGTVSVYMLLLIVLASLVIIVRGLSKSVKTVLDANDIEAERQAMELKLQESQISIMLSQIQPHFLYNTLNSIYQLCETNPMRARSMVNSFAEYLRNNLSSLEESGLISFETELSHVKTYLDIEKVRFEDTLEIEYDIRCDDFSVPVLTVQPIVENAVKHGTSKKRGGGRVMISTEEERDCYVIKVADTGLGFDPSKPKNDGKRHVGIENVRQRLSNMCGGTLTIESAVGEGTVATIRIPKGGKK